MHNGIIYSMQCVFTVHTSYTGATVDTLSVPIHHSESVTMHSTGICFGRVAVGFRVFSFAMQKPKLCSSGPNAFIHNQYVHSTHNSKYTYTELGLFSLGS